MQYSANLQRQEQPAGQVKSTAAVAAANDNAVLFDQVVMTSVLSSDITELTEAVEVIARNISSSRR
jgi:hypothetical protein